MRLLFFIDSLTSGGKERRLSQLMQGIKMDTDIEFSLAIMSTDIHYKEVFDLDIKIHYLIRNSKKDISVFYKFYRLCRMYRPDIVHCWDSMTAVYLIPACKLLKIRIINGMVIDSPVKQNLLNKYWLRARLSFPFSDFIVGNSEAGLIAYKAPREKSICIYNGLNLLRFQNLPDVHSVRKEIFGDFNGDIFVVGMVAAFEERKDYDTLIEAAVSLVSSRLNIRFVLVGDGVSLNRIKEKVPVSLSNKIIFSGKRSDVESLINSFDIGVLLTNSKVHGEGISNSIIEYMASGKPVIATSGGGTNEVIINGKNGFLIEPGNANQLIEKINLLMNDRLLMLEFGKEGRQMVLEKFNLTIMTRQYISLYNRILSKKLLIN